MISKSGLSLTYSWALGGANRPEEAAGAAGSTVSILSASAGSASAASNSTPSVGLDSCSCSSSTNSVSRGATSEVGTTRTLM